VDCETDPTVGLNALAKHVYEIAASKGWHDTDPLPRAATMLVNIHGEVSEAWEEVRKADFDPTRIYASEKGKPEGLPVELADVLIRVLDMAAALGIDIEHAVRLKSAFNETRPHRHGGKRA